MHVCHSFMHTVGLEMLRSQAQHTDSNHTHNVWTKIERESKRAVAIKRVISFPFCSDWHALGEGSVYFGSMCVCLLSAEAIPCLTSLSTPLNVFFFFSVTGRHLLLLCLSFENTNYEFHLLWTFRFSRLADIFATFFFIVNKSCVSYFPLPQNKELKKK